MDEVTTKRLDHLPVIGLVLQRLGIAKLIDDRVPEDPRRRVSTGRCVEAMILAILMGRHTLYRVNELLEPWDLLVGLGWSVDPASLHDNRLGRSLDATFGIGLTSLLTGVVLNGVRGFQLDLEQLHLDYTSVSVHGEYPYGEEPEDPDDPLAVPFVTRGYSRDYRPDLKQIVFGLVVSADGAVPVLGRAASGNRSEPLETRFMLGQLAKILPDPKGTILVGDSKLFSGETLLLAGRQGLTLLTMLPRSVGLWDEVYLLFQAARNAGEELTILKAVYPPAEVCESEPPAPEKEWRGRSFDVTYTWKEDEPKEGPATGRQHEFALRALVVESSSLRDQKTESVARRRDRERVKLERAVARLEKRTFHCEADAREAAHAVVARCGPQFHVMHHDVVADRVPIKRAGRGRPPKDQPPRYEQVWQVRVVLELDAQAVALAVDRESCFVLVTTVPVKERSDRELFQAYQNQSSVEGSFRWAKHPMAVAPIFLKSEERIAALGLVYVLALMVYALIQREVRRLLVEHGDRFPGNRGLTKTPTTEVVFRLFEGLDTIHQGPPTPLNPAVVTNITEAQVQALELLQHPLLENNCVRFTTPREVPRGRRGYRPPLSEGDADEGAQPEA